MKTVPARTPLVYAATILGCFLIGPVAAMVLGSTISPNALLVAAVAPLLVGSVMFFGIFFWIGWGAIALVFGGIAHVFRGRPGGRQSRGASDRVVPSGTSSFVVLGVCIGVVLGLLGLATSDGPALVSIGGWLALCIGYGALLKAAASSGYLPFPDDG